MIIHRIRCRNFKTFREEIELDFDALQGLYKVSGRIGAGKTTIGEAIIFGLFGSISGKNNADLISWGEKHGLVEIWYTCRNNDIYIRREINSYGQNPLHVEVNGEEMVFTNKRNAQSQLETEHMDATRTIMELLCVINFNNFKSLSTLNAKQSKEFLDYVFNFDILSKYIEGCQLQTKDIKKQLTANEAQLSILDNQLQRLKDFVKGDKQATQENINTLGAQLADRRRSDSARIAEIRNQLRTLHTRLGSIKAAGTAKKKEIDLIKAGKCPTCGAPIKSDHLAEKEEERKIMLESYNDVNTQIRDLTAQISQIESDLNNYIAEQQKLIKSQENELSRLAEQERLSQIESKSVKSDIKRIKKELQGLEIDKTEYEQLQSILSNDIRQSVLGSFIPALNNNIAEIANILNMQFIPVFDLGFNCYIVQGDLHVPTSSLSTGQLKMVDIVIVLAVLSSIMSRVNTNIVFLDELFANLDSSTRAELIEVLRYILPKTCTVLIVSHQDIDTELFDGHLRLSLEENAKHQKQTNIIYSYK